MSARRPSGFRPGYSRWDRRETGLKPENALSRVSQLIEVGEVEDANKALYDIITDNQTRRRQWSKTYEGIMMKLMELSVQLRESGMVKEALHKYRAMCMQSNVASLEEVVRFLVDLAEKRTEDARKQVDETILEGAEDLEDSAMETPETLILEAAGNALTKERIDRQQVVPWMRFLWEVYRVVLDIVKTHNKLELCYHGMANRAFEFCIKYKRFMEFRRLCDMLRQHLSQLMTNPRVSPNDVKISDPDTLQKFMETRFIQLSTAVKLEHWQQAYRTIEDIHMIMSLGKAKAKAKPQHMSVYYDKLMQVFWVSGNYLYHAHALYKLYTLSIKQNRKLSADDARNMASRLLLAALSIPVYDAQSSVLSDSYGVLSEVFGSPTNDNASRHVRMASLLGYSAAAERGPLISELLTKGVREAAHPELFDVYDLLEGEMAPLQFADRFKKILSFVESHDVLKEYIVPLRRVGIFRLLEQLGRVYDVMRLDDMKRVASFTDYTEVEETALTALKTRSLAVRFDYQNQCLRFESELFSSDGMRKQLGRLARRMALTSKMLSDGAQSAGKSAMDSEVVAIALEKEKKAVARKQMVMTKARLEADEEAKNILRRRDIIERRKEEAERRTAEAVKQKKLAAARELALKEARRKKEEQMRLEQLKQSKPAVPPFGLGATVVGATSGPRSMGGVEAATPGEVERQAQLTKEKEEELRQQAEFKKKAQQLAIYFNHMERALREEQWDLLNDTHVQETTQQAKLMEEITAKELEEARAQHARALEDKGRTMRMMPPLENYLEELMSRVDDEFELWAQNERERAEAQAAKEAEIQREREEEEEKRRKATEAEEKLEREEAERREEEEREAREKREAEEKKRQEELEAAELAERERKAAAVAAAAAAKPVLPPSAPSPVPTTMATGNGGVSRPPSSSGGGKYKPPMLSSHGRGGSTGTVAPTASSTYRPGMGRGGFGLARSGFSRGSSVDSGGSVDSSNTRSHITPISASRTPSAPSLDSKSSLRDDRPKSGAYRPPHSRNRDGSSGASTPSSVDAPPPPGQAPRLVGSPFGARKSNVDEGPPGVKKTYSSSSGGFDRFASKSSGGSDAPRRRPLFYNSKLGQKPPSEDS